MYKLEQLNSKELAELQAIASELGISNADKLDKSTLMFRIIDEQAEAAASGTEKPTRKRTRVSVKNVDRVYSATQNKTKKIDKKMQVTLDDTLFGSLSQEEKDMLTPIEPAEVPAPVETPEPKKRGRKKKTEAAPSEPSTLNPPTESPEPKKRGRKKKVEAAPETTDAKTTADATDTEKSVVPENNSEISEKSVVPEATYVPEADDADTATQRAQTVITRGSTEIASDESDFIIIQDIPAIEDTYYNPLEFFKRNEISSQPTLQTLTPDPSPVMGRGDHPDGFLPIMGEVPEGRRGSSSGSSSGSYNFDDIITVTGVLEVIDNYGFLRSSDYNYLPSPDDVYVNLQQIKHWGLKQGDVVEGHVRPPRTGEKFFPLVDVQKINGCDPQQVMGRIAFEFLTPLFPDQKFQLCKGFDDSKSSRIVDLFSPIGKGQRALIVAQPKTGKTLLMKDIANSIAANHPEAYLMMLLIDERPEEVTDMARTVNAEVIASTFDAPAENHVKIAGIVLEKAKRMVECGHDVVIFLDSITRLARAYNTVSPASGKVLSGGVDANALHKPKRFFGAARNIEGGGSLTIIATALIDTGSKMDEVIFEEFKGTGNMELQLDRSLANKRVFPAVNLVASSTRRDDLLQDQTTLNRMWVLRKHIADMNPLEAMDTVMNYIERTKNNEEFLISMNG